jgi:hypothetical protein
MSFQKQISIGKKASWSKCEFKCYWPQLLRCEVKRVLKCECERENIRANNERENRLPNERFSMHMPMRRKGKYISSNEMKRHQDWLI